MHIIFNLVHVMFVYNYDNYISFWRSLIYSNHFSFQVHKILNKKNLIQKQLKMHECMQIIVTTDVEAPAKHQAISIHSTDQIPTALGYFQTKNCIHSK